MRNKDKNALTASGKERVQNVKIIEADAKSEVFTSLNSSVKDLISSFIKSIADINVQIHGVISRASDV